MKENTLENFEFEVTSKRNNSSIKYFRPDTMFWSEGTSRYASASPFKYKGTLQKKIAPLLLICSSVTTLETSRLTRRVSGDFFDVVHVLIIDEIQLATAMRTRLSSSSIKGNMVLTKPQKDRSTFFFSI